MPTTLKKQTLPMRKARPTMVLLLAFYVVSFILMAWHMTPHALEALAMASP